ncbi:MAG: hypothetical protein OI74_05275, partial [Gammaproteobacteria bacterium (ex Lamellibrachia satsuma)]
MRILLVRFKNLNSLAGEWEIDLAYPVFSSDGIFAITGPTGAGKTTILDAVCLALYGRTPRLNKVTKSGNEIMSRQTGECFAEVTFETQAGRFRCHWSQHRARKKPGGELQAPKHEIADADSGRILEAKLRGVADQIETVTGMDFDRFTRSMLLAQGGFAAFLQAAPDERAPILEQITGTEIYSQISIQVHKQRAGEREKLDILQAELAGMQLLSEEDERQLQAGLEQMVLQETALNQDIDQNNQAIDWLDGIESLEKELGLLAKQKQDMEIRLKDFQPGHEKLERATQALELAGDFASLSSLRREQETDQQRRKACQLALPEQEAEVNRAEINMKLADAHLAQQKHKREEVLIVIRKVRELDLKLREKTAPVKTAEDGIFEMEQTLDNLRTEFREESQVLKEQKINFEEVQKLLSASEADRGLVEQLARILSQFDRLRELDGNLLDRAGELAAAEAQKQEANRLWNEHIQKLQAQKEVLETHQAKLLQQQSDLADILAERKITQWRDSLSELKERGTLLNEVSASLKSLTELRHTLIGLTTRHEKLTAEDVLLEQQIQAWLEKHAAFERELQLLETELSLLKKIEDLEEARHQLQDGKPCPLCGAEEHPYAERNVPVPDETRAALSRVRANLKQANETVTGLRVKQARNLKDLEQILIRQKETTDKIGSGDERIHEGLEMLSIDGPDKDGGDELGAVLLRFQQENEDNLQSTSNVVQAVEVHEKEIGTLRDSLESSKDAVIQSERDTLAAAHAKESAEQADERAKKALEMLSTQFQQAQEDALRDVSSYGVDSLAMNALDQVQSELTLRRDRWVSRQAEMAELERRISTLELQTQHQTSQISRSETELKNLRSGLDILRQERDSLTRERRGIFGDKRPDDEESRLSSAIKDREKHLEDSRGVFNSATQELSNLKSRVEAIVKAMLARAEQLKTGEERFHVRLGQYGFTDETSYQAACLPEEERNNLMQQAQRLATEQTELNARSRDRSSLLDIERKKQTTDQPRDILKQELEALVNRQKSLQQEVGGMRQKLHDNESLRRKQQDRAKLIDAQKRECSRWDLLHELIGSADGKKYRNFAQGLTFEMMV